MRTLRHRLHLTLLVCTAWLAIPEAAFAESRVQAAALTVARLKELKATSNEPAGDAFVDSRDRLATLIDAFVADSSKASPMYLYFAANTAARLGRMDDAAYLFYGAQMRKSFDLQRFNIATKPDGNNAVTYLAFLNSTTGEVINPAIMRQPAAFAAIIKRLDGWNPVAASDAYYPEFAEASGFKLPEAAWPALAAKVKDEFMSQFGRPMAALLNDKTYFDAFTYVQRFESGEIDAATPEAKQRLEKSIEIVEAAQERAFGASADAGATDVTVRVGGPIPEPEIVTRVEPKFPAGVRGAVILEVTISPAGRVTDVAVMRGEPPLVDAAEAAVRQWVFRPLMLNGRAVTVVHTIALNAR